MPAACRMVPPAGGNELKKTFPIVLFRGLVPRVDGQGPRLTLKRRGNHMGRFFMLPGDHSNKHQVDSSITDTLCQMKVLHQ
jgi:hypothetical protein